MADYGSKYTFRIDIEGQEAIDRGKELRKKLAEVLEAQLQPTVELTRALEAQEAVLQSVNEAITSQTRRLGYNMKRHEEAAASVDKLVQSLTALNKVTEEMGQDAFAALVKSARDAYNEIVGGSIIPQLVRSTATFLDELRQAQPDVFASLVAEAQSLGVTFDALLLRFERVRAMLEEDVSQDPFFRAMDMFVRSALVLPQAPGRVLGKYYPIQRTIALWLDTLMKEAVIETPLTAYHEIGHALEDVATRLDPERASGILASVLTEFTDLVAEQATTLLAEIQLDPARTDAASNQIQRAFQTAFSEIFAESFAVIHVIGPQAIGGVAPRQRATMMQSIEQLRALVVDATRGYLAEQWEALAKAEPYAGVFLDFPGALGRGVPLVGAPGPAGFLAEFGTTALVPQLEQVRDLVIQTAEVTPGVFVPLIEGADAAASVDKLVQSLVALNKVTEEIGTDAFAALVKSARDAYNELVGGSIIPEIVRRTLDELEVLRREEPEVFKELVAGAETAGVAISDIIARMTALIAVVRQDIGEVPLFQFLDKFVSLTAVGFTGPGGALGKYYKDPRAIGLFIEPHLTRSLEDWLFTAYHEFGHAFEDAALRMMPEEAFPQLARVAEALNEELIQATLEELEGWYGEPVLREELKATGEDARVAAAMAFAEILASAFAKIHLFKPETVDVPPAVVDAMGRLAVMVAQRGLAMGAGQWAELLAAKPFGGLVMEFDLLKIVGAPTLVPQIAEEARAALEELRSGQVGIFAPFVEEAQRAGVSADMLVERIEALQALVQRDISQDPFFATLSRFVESTTLQIGEAAPLAPFGRYGVETRQIQMYLAQLLEFSTEELLLATYHEYGHALVASVEQLAPEAARAFFERFKQVYVDEIELFDVEEVLVEKFARFQILGAASVKRRAADIFREMKDLVTLEAAKLPPEGAFLPRLIGAPDIQPFLEQLGTTALVPQLEQVRDLIIQTAEVAPGVFVPLVEGADAAADRTRLLHEEVRKLLETFISARMEGFGAAGVGGVPLLTAGAGAGMGGGGFIGTRIGFGDWPEGWFRDAAPEIAEAAGWMDRFNIAVNQATIQYFGLRRLGYGLESVGASMRQMSQATIGALEEAADAYYDFSAATTRAGIAMELQAELFPVLESRILDASIALGLFAPEQIAEGLRLWAAGTGVVIQTQEDLNKTLLETVDIQQLAVLNNVDLAETTTNVGAVLVEYDLALDQTRRTSEVLNFVAAKTFANVNDVGQAFRFVGPLAKEAGDSLEVTAAALAMAADAGIRGSAAGRALRQIYIQLLDPTEEHNEAMNDAFGLSEDLGQSWQDLVFPGGEFIGLAKYIDLLAAATENYTAQQRLELLATISTANELPLLVSLVSQQIEGRKEGINILRAYEKTILGVADEETRLYAQFVEQQTGMVFTTQSAATLMKEQWQTLTEDISFEIWQLERRHDAAMTRIGQSASEALLPLRTFLTEVIEEVSSFVAKYPGVATVIAGIGLGTGILAQLFSITGKIAGAAANIMIMAFVAKEFGISTTVFSAAVKEFAAARGIGVGEAGAAGIGALLSQALAAFLGTWAGAAAYPRLTEALPEVFPETIYSAKGLTGVFNLLRDTVLATEYQLSEAFGYMFRDLGIITEQERVERMKAIGQLVLDLSYFGTVLKAAGDRAAAGLDAVSMAAAGWTLPTWEELKGGLPGLMQLPGIAGLTKMQREAIERYGEYLTDRQDLQEEYDDRLEELQDKHLKAQGKALDDYLRERTKAIEDYDFRELRIEEDHQRSLLKLRERYDETVAQIHEKYDEAVARAAEQNNDRIAQYMEDYHKRMERMRLDHVWRMEDLIRERDARGLLLEMRSYKRRVREAEEDRGDWLKRQKEDQAKQLEEAAKARDKALEEAKKDYGKQLKEQQEQFDRERDRREEDFGRRLDEMKENYERQRTERDQQYEDDKQVLIDAMGDELEELKDALALELAEILDYIREVETAEGSSYTDRLKALETFLLRRAALLRAHGYVVPTPPPLPHFPEGAQAGGYAYAGIYRLGEAGREFILTAPTTRALESFLGPLTQERVLSGAFTHGGGGAGSRLLIEVNQPYWTFQGSFTAEEKLWFQETARAAAYEAVDDVVHEVLGA